MNIPEIVDDNVDVIAFDVSVLTCWHGDRADLSIRFDMGTIDKAHTL